VEEDGLASSLLPKLVKEAREVREERDALIKLPFVSKGHQH
jgi:hypothetical protein